MTPLLPVQPAPALAVAPATVEPVPSGAETSAAPPPALGAQAVTQVTATKPVAARDEDRKRHETPEIPPDPPPVKGLGIPPLNTARVGDFDRIETPPPPEATGQAFASSRASLNASASPTVDLRR